MKKVLVLGIGNRLMMDDGIGVYIVEELSKRKQDNNTLYVVGETDVNFCMQCMEGMLSVIIIDAAYFGNDPGSIYTIPVNKVLQGSLNMFSQHEFDLLRQLKTKGKAVEGMFIGIEPKEIAYGLQLSDALKDKFEDIINIVGKAIEVYKGE